MKRIQFYILLLPILIACSEKTMPLSQPWECAWGLCIKLEASEPIKVNLPFYVIVTLTSEVDIPELNMHIGPSKANAVQVKLNNEKPYLKVGAEDEANWLVDVKANQPLTFTRKVTLLQGEGGFIYSIFATAVAPSGIEVSNSFNIYFTENEGKVYHQGTKIPYTSVPLPFFQGTVNVTNESISTPSAQETLPPTVQMTIEPNITPAYPNP